LSIQIYEPEGIIEEHLITVNGAYQYIYAFPYRWFSVEVENTGPNPVFVMINNQGVPNATTLNATEARDFDYKRPTIFQVRFLTAQGQTATVKVTTER
jgi:hypothetical protein